MELSKHFFVAIIKYLSYKHTTFVNMVLAFIGDFFCLFFFLLRDFLRAIHDLN